MEVIMKKFLNMLLCLTLVIVSAYGLCACQSTPTNDYITANTSGASFSGSDVVYKNADDFKVVYKGDNHYVLEGSASVMNEEQATTWGTVANSKYVVLTIKMGEGAQAIIGWRDADTMGKAYTEEEIDGNIIKRSTAKNATKNYILAITDGDTPRHPELTIWRIEVTAKDTTEAVVYTVDFSEMYK